MSREIGRLQSVAERTQLRVLELERQLALQVQASRSLQIQDSQQLQQQQAERGLTTMERLWGSRIVDNSTRLSHVENSVARFTSVQTVWLRRLMLVMLFVVWPLASVKLYRSVRARLRASWSTNVFLRLLRWWLSRGQ
eukprot:TRINITY_DN31857_c0_g1_i1.p1 TRINITY_DN31857_c0_g1~~TRINITY_DN31857_c0_g1_i1.p1  ORF type:complete len:138 (+),score=35.35 TRINITY_DN31857_c0_g1_i1:261-674(+)